MSDNLAGVASVAALIFGFGFVIFWHELGHFLAAKWVGIKVEQFAVGFGNALVAWRKGVGFTVGSSEQRFKQRVEEEWRKQTFGDKPADGVTGDPDEAQTGIIAKSLGLGETEYRLNWVPLGGYVKMLGQDDAGPVAGTGDPRAYPNKSIGARMVVISAGVLMNILLAILGFMLLFRIGFGVTPPVVGQVTQNGPADVAGIRPGDRILSINGRKLYDFNGVLTTVALCKDGEAIPFVVERDGAGKDGKKVQTTITVTPRKPVAEGSAFVAVGIGPIYTLAGPSGRGQYLTDYLLDANGKADEGAIKRLTSPGESAVRPHEVVTKVNGVAVKPEDYLVLSRMLEENTGQPIAITVRTVDGGERTTQVEPSVALHFGTSEWSIGGMKPRNKVMSVDGRGPNKEKPLAAPADGQIFPGDILTGATLAVPPYDQTSAEPFKAFTDFIDSAGQQGRMVVAEVLRDGKLVKTEPMLPVVKEVYKDKKKQTAYRLGIAIGPELSDMTIGSVDATSPAGKAGIEAGAELESVNGKPVTHWLEAGKVIREAATGANGAKTITFGITGKDGTKKDVVLTLDKDQVASAAIRAELPINIDAATEVRKTESLVTAAKWGLAATRDFVLQSYVTVLRMTQQSISPTNLQGPLGIVHTGGLIAWSKPPDWILWFVCMISANLAVVNFLPLPILDGGHFVLLCIEKIRGKALSERAMGAVQMTGLALIGCVFLFVTFNDLSRLLGYS